MKFQQTPLAGSWTIDLELIEDERGFFARSFCRQEFIEHGLDPECAQCNISYNRVKGTVRGMHYQIAPYEEAKLVRCTSGAIFDVIVDLRADSATFCQHFSVELSSANRKMLFIPKGFAHGFQTLQDHTEIFYQMSTAFEPGTAGGFRFDDPAINIQWPCEVTAISERDLAFEPIHRKLGVDRDSAGSWVK